MVKQGKAKIVTPPAAEVAEAGTPAELGVVGRKTGKKKGLQTVRLTLDLPRELDFRLHGIAQLTGQHKGAFALRLITQGLRSYKADESLRAVYQEIRGQLSEVA